jgi:hypothetical protein
VVTDNQKRSRKQERRGAKVYGGKVNSGSGNTDGYKNDVRTPDLSIEFKTTKQKSYNLRLDALRNAEKEALLSGREVLFGVDFETASQLFRYVIMPEYNYLNLYDLLEAAEGIENDLLEAERRIRELEDEVAELEEDTREMTCRIQELEGEVEDLEHTSCEHGGSACIEC